MSFYLYLEIGYFLSFSYNHENKTLSFIFGTYLMIIFCIIIGMGSKPYRNECKCNANNLIL